MRLVFHIQQLQCVHLIGAQGNHADAVVLEKTLFSFKAIYFDSAGEVAGAQITQAACFTNFENLRQSEANDNISIQTVEAELASNVHRTAARVGVDWCKA